MATKRKKPDLPNLSNATPEFIVDELGRIREQLNDFKMMEGYYKQALMGRRLNGQNAIQGQTFDCLIEETSQVRIIADKVREYLANDPEGLKAVSDEITMQVVRTTRKTESGAT